MNEVGFPGDLLAQALLRAATEANLGIVISEVVGDTLQAVYTSPEILRMLGRTQAEIDAEPSPVKFIAPEEVAKKAGLIESDDKKPSPRKATAPKAAAKKSATTDEKDD